ncbi:MAG: hypothetical protein HY673_18195 [Chloroflexi bacterium]|nr:hypothetical protein [Chloroflexota bacterium]
MTTLEVYDPTGSIEVTRVHAPRLEDLHGKTICELSDNRYEADRTFPLITSLLREQFPDANIIEHTEFPELSSSADVPNLEDAVKAQGCQAAIIGNAG